MILVEGALENSGVVDSEHGRAIFISTTARMYFRKAFPTYSKVRNKLMNEYIAKAFSGGRIVDYFKPKKSGSSNAGDVGEIREVGGAKIIGIVAGDSVRVIAVKGTPSGVLPALPVELPGQPGPGSPGGTAPSGGNVGEALKGAT